MLLNIIMWLAIGGLAGWVGFLIAKPHTKAVGTFIIIGIFGSVAGGVLPEVVDLATSETPLDPMGLMIALVCSIFFVFLYVIFTSSKKQQY